MCNYQYFELPRFIWIGDVSKRGHVKAVRVEYFSESNDKGETPSHFLYRLDQGERWRYVEQGKFVFWYYDPDPLYRQAVEDYLTQRGIRVNHHRVYGGGWNNDQEEYYESDIAHGHERLPQYMKFKQKGKVRQYVFTS